jgi:hypothetical protein
LEKAIPRFRWMRQITSSSTSGNRLIPSPGVSEFFSRYCSARASSNFSRFFRERVLTTWTGGITAAEDSGGGAGLPDSPRHDLAQDKITIVHEANFRVVLPSSLPFRSAARKPSFTECGKNDLGRAALRAPRSGFSSQSEFDGCDS